MNNKYSSPFIIFGSSRSNGNTRKIVDLVVSNKQYEFLDLNKIDISYYDYKHENIGDDFIPLIEKIVKHDKVVFATPIYWYTMSAIMKTFLDRITDLLTIKKDLGRKLKGKQAYLIAVDGGNRTNEFENTFKNIFNYLDMDYKGGLFCYSGDNQVLISQNNKKIKRFSCLLYEQNK